MYLEGTRLTPVPIIASFSDKGKICPLYIKVDGERYHIESYRVINNIHPWLSFQCRITANNLRKEFELSFHEELHLWGIGTALIPSV